MHETEISFLEEKLEIALLAYNKKDLYSKDSSLNSICYYTDHLKSLFLLNKIGRSDHIDNATVNKNLKPLVISLFIYQAFEFGEEELFTYFRERYDSIKLFNDISYDESFIFTRILKISSISNEILLDKGSRFSMKDLIDIVLYLYAISIEEEK